MRLKKLLGKGLALILIPIIMFVSYALDIDTVFGIRAGAEDYSERATSLLEFYKSGTVLDRTKVSSDELYVFGVFMSNFLMPFQSVVGNMSSDSYATKLAETFFGASYTAQQFSDMQYTLGLVQSAQAGRKRIVSVKDGTTCSLEVLLRNFGGFYSRYQDSGASADPIMYKYEGGSNKDIVWQVNSDMFDAVIGQVISICPTQAGAYFADSGASTRQLYVDCFGNISDAKGVVIIPACMNPYSFVNGYLTSDRQISNSVVKNDEKKSSVSNQYACPLQLPINNAFWMGCMVTPQDIVTMVTENVQDSSSSDKDKKQTAKTSLKKTYVSLPMLYAQVDKWSKSTTVLVGLDSMDGSELGIYFSNRIWEEFKNAYRVAKGVDPSKSDVDKGVLDDMPNIWNYVGGTSIPATGALADIALFNTYAPFSESLASTITVMNMYLDGNDAWWASDESKGDSVKSLYAEYMAKCETALESNKEDKAKMDAFKLKAQAYVFYCSEKAKTAEQSADLPILERALILNRTGKGEANGTSALHIGGKDYRTEDLIREIAATDLNKDLVGKTIDKVTSTDELIALCSNVDNIMVTPRNKIVVEKKSDGSEKAFELSSVGAGSFYGVLNGSSWAQTVLWKDPNITVFDKDKLPEKTDVDKWGDMRDSFIRRTTLAIVLDDPLFLLTTQTGSDDKYTDYSFFTAIRDVNNKDASITDSVIAGSDGKNNKPIDNNYSVGWLGTYTYSHHYFLQKAHVASLKEGTYKGGLVVAYEVVLCLVLITAGITMLVMAAGATVPAYLVASLAITYTVGLGLSAAISVHNATHGGGKADANNRLGYIANHSYGKSKALAVLGYYALNNTDSTADKTIIGDAFSGDMYLALCKAYGLSYSASAKDTKSLGTAFNDKNATAKMISNYAVSDYTLYSPYRGLSSSLAAVSKVYTEQGIVSGDEIKTAVGSYITNDVNLWGGIYYAYMIDIFGLTINADNEMSAAKLITNLPPVPSNLTGSGTPDISGLLDSGNDISDEQAETNNRRKLMERLMELTDTNDSSYRDNLISTTINSTLCDIHNDIVNADSTGSIDSVGSGNLYTGYSGYITTSTLAEMPFTSWIMQSYDVIYIVLMILVIVLAICMLVTGHRTWRKAVFSALSMAIILLIPRISIDTAVTMANNTASALYKDRFSFWAYAQHQQYANKLANSKSETETLIIQNIQQAKDYYDSGSGVTVKWMSPKKSSYWDKFTDVTGGSDSGLNLSLFTWLFQGQFRQEIYSTDNLATYLYRPYLDIINTANSVELGTYQGIKDGSSKPSKDSASARSNYAYYTRLAWANYQQDLVTNWDIIPAVLRVGNEGKYTTTKDELDLTSAYTAGTFDKTHSKKDYVSGIVNTATNDWAYSHYVSEKSKATDLSKAYPATSTTSVTVGVNPPDSKTKKELGKSTQQFLLYTESPYYYFYYMFKEMASQYEGSDRPVHKLLVDEAFYKYLGEDSYVDPASGAKKDIGTWGTVSEGEIVDFLDLENLFTYVIPYLEQSNLYVSEWSNVNGTDIDASLTGDKLTKRKAAVRNIWSMYSPWVDAMYSTGYASGSIGSIGKKYAIPDTINPGYYLNYRQMVFSPADKIRNNLTDADLSDVEARIIRTLEDTYTDFMYLNNYASFDEEVLLGAMAMTATFNFNKNFSENNLVGDSITLYPTGFEIRNFSYDAFLRMALLNTTGSSLFSDKDIYTEVVENTSVVTALLMIVNDAVAVYGVPTLKLITLLLLFLLGLILCINCFMNPPDKLWMNLLKSYFLPFGMFIGALFVHMLVASLFVGEGLTGVVGSRGITITTGDPTVTIILMLIANCIFCFIMFLTIKTLLKSFVLALKDTFGGVVSLAGGALAVGAGAFAAGKTSTSGVKFNSNRKRAAYKKNNSLPAGVPTAPDNERGANKGEYVPKRRPKSTNTGTAPETGNKPAASPQTPPRRMPSIADVAKMTATDAKKPAVPTASRANLVNSASSAIKTAHKKLNDLKTNGEGTVIGGATAKARLGLAKAKYSVVNAANKAIGTAKIVTSKDFRSAVADNIKTDVKLTTERAKQAGSRYLKSAGDFVTKTARKTKQSVKNIPQNIKSSASSAIKFAEGKKNQVKNFADRKYKKHEELEAIRRADRARYSVTKNRGALQEARADAELNASFVGLSLQKRALQRQKQLELLQANKQTSQSRLAKASAQYEKMLHSTRPQTNA